MRCVGVKDVVYMQCVEKQHEIEYPTRIIFYKWQKISNFHIKIRKTAGHRHIFRGNDMQVCNQSPRVPKW